MNNWQEEDLKYIWHPCSQMKDYEELPPIVIERGEGINLYDTEGNTYKDVVSSWWCNLLGHSHPRINLLILLIKQQLLYVKNLLKCCLKGYANLILLIMVLLLLKWL
jgi:adenosylmethionine-8-amino-7-oxononanoate aminotransferase